MKSHIVKTKFFIYLCDMKKISFGLIFLVFVLSSCSGDKEKVFVSLDTAISQQKNYDQAFETMRDSLYQLYKGAGSDDEKWAAAYNLQKIFFYHDLDSSHTYATKLVEHSGKDLGRLACGKAYFAHCLFRMDSLAQAWRVFQQIDTALLDDKERTSYYNAGYHIIRSMAQKNPELEPRLAGLVRDWALSDSTSVESVYYCSHFHGALSGKEVAERLKNCVVGTLNDTSKVHFYMARSYLEDGDTHHAILHYVKSAEYDLKVSAKAYSAMYELAMILLDQGDVARANKYMRLTLNDTRSSHYRIHYNSITNASLHVMDELADQKDKRQRAYLLALLMVGSLLGLALFLTVSLRRYSSRLEASHDQVSELSKIKDAFLANYMEKCVDYLNKVDDYRSSLRHAMKTEGQDAVKAMLRKPSYAAEEFGALLEMFDMSFLGIFPDFVENVNAHMQPQWQLEQPAPGRLSMELRVLALIRMGITKSQRIARALNLSITTVYSYHYNLRKHSLHANEDFDAIIAGL